MAPPRPILGDLELEHVQEITADGEQVWTRHDVPALEGDFLQGLGRRAARLRVAGVLHGAESAAGLGALREKFRAAEPLAFVADIATATGVGEVLIEDLAVRELAGRPERFAYDLGLREFLEPPADETADPPEIEEPEIPDEPIAEDVGTLVVEVLVPGDPGFDLSRVVVSARGTASSSAATTQDGTEVARTLASRQANIWTEERFPAGQHTVEAQAPGTVARAASAPATVTAGETTEVTLTLLAADAIRRAFVVHFRFDSAFVEPCMKAVLSEAAEHAGSHPDEKLLVVGHTDKAGSRAYNQSLSERRARAAYAWLTSAAAHEGLDRAVEEWTALRRERPAGELPSVADSWGLREVQHMLQDRGFYPGNVDGQDGPLTRDGVRAFRCQRGLPPGTAIDDPFWDALIRDYLGSLPLAVEAASFLPNCEGEILKWLGCGEDDALVNTDRAHRPSRRTELLFLTGELPCEPFRPVTFELPEPGAVNQDWCRGPEDPQVREQRGCYLVPADPARRDPEADEGKLLRPPPAPTLTAAGTVRHEDGTPFAGRRIVLLAPDGTFRQAETAQGTGQPARTDAAGRFSFPDLSPGVYALEVREDVLARLAEDGAAAIRGNAVCKRLETAADTLDVVISPAPVLREIRLPAVAHLMSALHPTTREVRTCADPNDPSLRRPQATRRDAVAVLALFERANGVLRQARVRLDPVEVVEEVFATERPECEVTVDEFGRLLDHCAHPNAVNVFFVGDLEGATEAGFYGIVTVGGARGQVDGCAVSDRFETSILGIRQVRETTDEQSLQVLAHEVAHFLSLDHVADIAANADRLMLPGTGTGSNDLLIDDEVEQIRASCNAALECATLTLRVEGATRIGGASSHRHLVVARPGGVVTVQAEIPAALVDPAVGTLSVTPSDPGDPTRRSVPTGTPGTTLVVATHTPAGADPPTCSPSTAGPPGAPVPRVQKTWAAVQVVEFTVRVEGATQVGGAGSTDFVATVDATGTVVVIAELAPAPFCVPRDLVTWSAGQAAADPLRRLLSRATAGETVLRASLAGVERELTVTVVEVGIGARDTLRIGDPADNAFFAVEAAGNVTLVAELTPLPANDEGLVTWTGGDAAPEPHERLVSKGQVGTTVVIAQVVGTAQPAQVTIAAFELEVEGATRIGGAQGEGFVTLSGNGQVSISAAIDPLPDPLPPGFLTWSGGSAVPGRPLERRVSRRTRAATPISATVAGTTRSLTVHVVGFTLRVEGAEAVQGQTGRFVTTVDDAASVTVIAELDPAIQPAPADLVDWQGAGETDAADPLRRNVSREVFGELTVRATVAGVERSVTLTVIGFSLRVEGAQGLSGAASTEFITHRNATETVSVRLLSLPPIDDALARRIVRWQGGTAVPGSATERRVSRRRVALEEVRATIAGETRQVSISVIEVVLVAEAAQAGQPLTRAQIEGMLNEDLANFGRGDVIGDQADSLLRARVDLPGVDASVQSFTAEISTTDPEFDFLLNGNRDIELTRDTGDRFLSSVPILLIPDAIQDFDIARNNITDIEVIQARAGGRFSLSINASSYSILGRPSVDLGALGETDIPVRGRVAHVFAQAFLGSTMTAALIEEDITQANRIWAQAGVEIRIRPFSNLVDVNDAAVPPAGLLDLETISGRTPFTGTLTAEERQLLGIAQNGPARSPVANDLNVYYVRSFVEPNPSLTVPLGALAYAQESFPAIVEPTHSGVAVWSTHPGLNRTLLAHEIGHHLLRGWPGDEHQDRSTPPQSWPRHDNIMSATVDFDSVNVDETQVLNILQRTRANNHPVIRFLP